MSTRARSTGSRAARAPAAGSSAAPSTRSTTIASNGASASTDVAADLARVADAPLPADTAALPPIVSADDASLVPQVSDTEAGIVTTSPTPASKPSSVVVGRRRPRVRRVTRVVRHVDTWSVFKVALVFNAVLYGVCLTAGVLLWNVAYATGTIDNVEQFFEQFGWSSFEFDGGEIYHNAWIGGLFVVIGLTGFVVLVATMFNLITDLVGGIRVSVLEEEVVARSSRNG